MMTTPASPYVKHSPLPTIIMSTSESDKVKQMLAGNFNLRFASGAGYKLLLAAQGRVAAYVLSKRSIYLWDCCAPHAILRAAGGGIVRFHDTMAALKTAGACDKAEEDGLLDAETLRSLEVNYTPMADGSRKIINGVIAYSSPALLDIILRSLAESH
jgi:hypothetical protein